MYPGKRSAAGVLVHFYPDRGYIGRRQTRRPQHRVLGKHFAVHLGDKIVLPSVSFRHTWPSWMDFTATSKLLHRWKSLSGYRDRPSPSIRPVVPQHYERLGKACGRQSTVWGRALLPVQAVRRTAGSRRALPTIHSLLRLTLDFGGLSCPAASPLANRHEPDATKAPARPLPGRNQAPCGRPGRARVPVPTPARASLRRSQPGKKPTAHRTRPRPGNSAAAQHSLSRRDLRLAPPQRMGTAGRDDSLRPVH